MIIKHKSKAVGYGVCNGCNSVVPEGYLIYLGKREYKVNHPYDYYCAKCTDSCFPTAVEQS